MRSGVSITEAEPAGRKEPEELNALDTLERRIITHLQDGLPLVSRPFAEAAAWLGVSEDDLLIRLIRLKEAGLVMRIGPLINADAAGGAYMLAALAVPEERFDEVVDIVNSFDEVAHNYARDHEFNMWFVIAAPTRERIGQVVRAIERATGLPVLQLPKEKEYFVDFRVRLVDEELNGESSANTPRPATLATPELDAADRRLLGLMQPGLPLQPEPWRAFSPRAGMSVNEILHRTRLLLAAGIIRRVALVPNHYRLGMRANGMSVWDVDDARIDELGARVGALPFVSHCYRRPRRKGWPYNLFAMVHGRTREEALARADDIAAVLGPAARARQVLFSTRILKKTGTRLFTPTRPETERMERER